MKDLIYKSKEELEDLVGRQLSDADIFKIYVHEMLHKKMYMMKFKKFIEEDNAALHWTDSYKYQHDLPITHTNVCMETEVDFWIPVDCVPVNEQPQTNDYCLPIKVKPECFNCGKQFKIIHSGDKSNATKVSGCLCFLPYGKFWQLRVIESKPIKNIDPANDGCRCKSCKDWYPMSEPNQADGSMICWSCRQ